MGKLLNLIRDQRRRREGDVMVILINDFCCQDDFVPNTSDHLGNTLLEMAPDEAFETFEARAVAAAKASGANFVAINVRAPPPIEGGRSKSLWPVP
jgi:hypothetical protein